MMDKQKWQTWRFDQIAANINERVDNPREAGVDRYVGLEHLDPESLKIRRWGSPSDVEATKLRFYPGDIIFGRRRAYQRKLGVAEFEGICSAHAMVLRAKPEVVLPEFLPFFIQSDLFMERAIEISVGSLSPTINWKTLAVQEFALPPLDEQRRITQLLKQSQKLSIDLGDTRQSLEAVKIATLSEQIDNAIHSQISLAKVCEMQNGRSFPGDKYQDIGIRLLRPGNLAVNGYLTWQPDKTVCLPLDFRMTAIDYIIYPGDILVNLTAQSLEDGFMGRVCIAGEDDLSLLNQRIGRLYVNSKEAYPRYIFRSLQTPRFQRHAIAMCEGTKVKHIYWRHLEDYKLHLPTYSEQIRLANSLDQIDSAIDTVQARQFEHQKLAQSLLNGSLRAIL